MKQRKKENKITNNELSGYLDILSPVIGSILNANGFSLFDLAFITENQTNYLRVTLSHQERLISLDDCELASREIGKELDKQDLIPFAYVLEVQSPGKNINTVNHEFILDNLGLVVKS